MIARLLIVAVGLSWALDSRTSALEPPVRLAYVVGLTLVVLAALSGRIRVSHIPFVSGFLVLNSLWLFAGFRDGRALGPIAVDLAVVVAFGCAVFASNGLVRDFRSLQSAPLVAYLALALSAAFANGVLFQSGGRGELPPTLLVAISAALLVHRRYVPGLLGFGAYFLLTVESGFRSSALLVIVTFLLLGLRFIRKSAVWRKALILIAAIPLAVVGANLSQQAFGAELASDTRAFQLSSATGTNAAASDETRIAEIESMVNLARESSSVQLIVGRGHGAAVLEEELDRRTAHNVFFTTVIRYGVIGLLVVLWLHGRVLRHARAVISGDLGLLDMMLSLGAVLVLLNGYLRYSIAELSEFLVLGLAVGRNPVE